jgi:hypothetical protein
MGLPKTVVAFGAGCLAAGLVAWLVVDVNAQSKGEDGIHVCVASDRVLRLAQGIACMTGEKSLYFKKPDPGVDDAKPDKDTKPGKDTSSDKERIAQLEERIRNLEDAANRGELGNKVVAPFTVVDRDGKRIFDVDRDANGVRAQVYSASDEGVATMWGLNTGGQFVARSVAAGAGDVSAYLGIFRNRASGVQVLEGGAPRLDLGRDGGSGAYRLKVFGSDGKAVAGIGQNSVGAGTAQVADQSGVVRAVLAVDDKGHADIYNGSGVGVALLTEGPSAGGNLTIYGSAGSKAGAPMVEAGVTAEGIGVVRAGPEGFKPGLGLLGLPGSYIAGKK